MWQVVSAIALLQSDCDLQAASRRTPKPGNVYYLADGRIERVRIFTDRAESLDVGLIAHGW